MRTALRSATAHAHDLLDEAMRRAAGWDDLAGYGKFLELQYGARAPIEAWLASEAPPEFLPPPQCPLIAQDLASLGITTPAQGKDFEHKEGDQPCGAASQLGASWVLAGSALGNRSILAELKREGRCEWPHSFLGDDKMLLFWNRLRPQIEKPASRADIDAAKRSALAVFAHFLDLTKAKANPVIA